jgi:nucleoside diphosphate kinase homolog 5
MKPRIIITGPVGCGKTTQAINIKYSYSYPLLHPSLFFFRNEFGVVYLSIPTLLDQALSDPNRSLLIGTYIENGELPPDALLIQLLSERLQQHDCLDNGWILDGFPLTRSQAENLHNLGIDCDALLVLEPPVSNLIERASSRVIGQNMIRNRMRIRSESDEDDSAEDFKTNLSHVIECFPQVLRIPINGNSNQIWFELYPKLKKFLYKRVIFLLGGPCSGKYSHCIHIQNEYPNISYLSLDSLIETEKKQKTELYKTIKYATDRGTIIPSDIVCNLILTYLLSCKQNPTQLFLIDSFPRNLNDLMTWLLVTERYCVIELVISLRCSEEVILNRLNEQQEQTSAVATSITKYYSLEQGGGGDTSGGGGNELKMDENASSIAKRFKIFREFTLPVIAFFKRCGKLCDINAFVPMNTVYSHLTSVLNALPILPQYERTVLVLDPNILREGKIGLIFEEIKSCSLTTILTKFVILTEKVIEILYKQFLLSSLYQEIITIKTSGPSLVVVVEGTDAIRRIRTLVGPEDPSQAKITHPTSLRARYGINMIQNVCSCSLNDVSALLDIDLWFNPSKPGYQCAIQGPSYDLEKYESVVHETQHSNSLLRPSDLSDDSDTNMIPTEDTLVLVKPYSSDIYAESIRSILILHGYEILSEVKLHLNEKLIDDLYSWRIGSIPYHSFKELLLTGLVIALHIRRVSAIKGMKYLIGSDDPNDWKTCRKDCIRAIYGLNRVNNCLESSDSVQIAMKELNFYFPQTCRLFQQQLITSGGGGGGGGGSGNEKKMEISSKDMPRYVEKIRLTAKRRKKNQGPETMSLLRHGEMLKYLTDEVNPVMKDLLQRILIQRPKDVLGYAIKDLIEQQRLSMESTSRMKVHPPLKPLPQPPSLLPPLMTTAISPPPIVTLPSILPPSETNFEQKNIVTKEMNSEQDEEAMLLMDLLGLGLKLPLTSTSEDENDAPCYNGKPLTLDIAQAEIIRLRNTIQIISQNILTDNSSKQSDELMNQPVSDSTSVSDITNTIKHLEIFHFSDLVGMGKEYDDLLTGDAMAKFVTTIKQRSASKPLTLFSGNFLGCTKSFTSSHFSSMFELLNTAGTFILSLSLSVSLSLSPH